jgi:hypothetical protein
MQAIGRRADAAIIVKVSGYPPLANLYNVSIAKMDLSGLLCATPEVGNGRHGPMEWRQTLWCVVAHVGPT